MKSVVIVGLAPTTPLLAIDKSLPSGWARPQHVTRQLEDESIEGLKRPFDELMDTLSKTAQDGIAISLPTQFPTAAPSRESVTPQRSPLFCFSIPMGLPEATQNSFSLQSSFPLQYESIAGAQG